MSRAETCERCGGVMRRSSDKSRVEIQSDGVLPLPDRITYNVMLDFECTRCSNRSSVLDDSQIYVRSRTRGRRLPSPIGR